MSTQKNNSENRVLTLPNLLSVFRICLIPLCVWLYCFKQDNILATLVLLLSGLTDVVDGFIARRFHMVSNVGKILDPIADKLTQGVMLICLVVRYRLILLPLCLMVVKEILTSIGGLLAIRKSKAVYCAKWHGKLATVLLYLTLFVHILWSSVPSPVSTVLILLCSAAILLSLVLYGSLNLHLITASGEGAQ